MPRGRNQLLDRIGAARPMPPLRYPNLVAPRVQPETSPSLRRKRIRTIPSRYRDFEQHFEVFSHLSPEIPSGRFFRPQQKLDKLTSTLLRFPDSSPGPHTAAPVMGTLDVGSYRMIRLDGQWCLESNSEYIFMLSLCLQIFLFLASKPQYLSKILLIRRFDLICRVQVSPPFSFLA